MRTKMICICLLVLCLSENLWAQRTTIKFQVGYGVPFLKSYPISIAANGTTTVQAFSFGTGLRLEGGVIEAIRQNLSLQLDFGYLSGARNSFAIPNATGYFNASYYSKFYDVAPMVRVSTDEGKIKYYAAVGPMIGFGKFYAETTSGSGATSGRNITIREYRGSYALGAKAELGAHFQRGNISYFAQLTFLSMRYAPTNSEITTYMVNSVDLLNTLTPSQKQTTYSNSITTSTPNPNVPSKGLQNTYPFDSISLNVGVMFRL